MRRTLLLAAALLAPAASAQMQKILIPVYFNADGAGASWQTFLLINNGMSKPFSSSNLVFFTACGVSPGCPTEFILPGEVNSPISPTSTPAGIVLFVPADEADRLVFRLMIGARPRNLPERGTEIPVVRERDFRTDLISLPYIELHGPVRARLRVYDPDQHAHAQVRVTLRDWNDPIRRPPLASAVLDLLPPPGSFSQIPPPVTMPSYAELDLQAAFAETILHGTLFNVDVEPLTPGLRFWAFATITDNATNDVQTVTPH